MSAPASLTNAYPQVKSHRPLQRLDKVDRRTRRAGTCVLDYDLVLKLVLPFASSPSILTVCCTSTMWSATMHGELISLLVQARRSRAAAKRLRALIPSVEQRNADALRLGSCRRCLNVLTTDEAGASVCAGCQHSIDEWLAYSQACPAETALGFPILHRWGDEYLDFCKALAEAASFGNDLALQLKFEQTRAIHDAGAFGACCLHSPI
jgi:hypothetical protein